MMREPTSPDVAFTWWRAALAGEPPPIHENDPQPGFYETKLVKGGPDIPVRIYLHGETDEAGELVEPEELRAEQNGHEIEPAAVWLHCSTRPISQGRYEYLMDLGRWAAAHEPDHPQANPKRKIDISRLAPDF